MSRRFWGRKMQFIAFVRAKNRAERSPKGVGSIGLVRRSALRGAVQVQSSIRRALGRSAKRSALTAASVASELYGIDLIGSAVGALLVTVILIPLLGIIRVSFVIGGLSFVSAIIALLNRKRYLPDAP